METVGCSAQVLELIARASNLAIEKAAVCRQYPQYREALNIVERDLKHAKQKLATSTKSPDTESIAELYRIAGLIYLYRAGRRLSSDDSQVSKLVRIGLDIAAGLQACPRAFPVFILGCEAHSDEERLMILGLLRRTQAGGKIASIAGMQQFVEASWAQDDLRPDEDLDYLNKLNAIMSHSENIPSFA